MRDSLTPVGTALAGGALMALWVAYVNRPLVERYTVVYMGQEMQFQGALGFGWKRDTGRDTIETPYFDSEGNWISGVPL